MEYFVNIILLFFVFSFVGWCIEVFLKYRQYHRFINRGFFTGPCLPIYGSGAVLITLSVTALAGIESSVGTTFVISFIVCGVIEYMTSYFMEKRFQARWWDYSTKPMNLHGRVWIGNLILFGLGGLIIIEIANPLLFPLFEKIPLLAREIIDGVLCAVFLTDYIFSHFMMRIVKQGIEASEADNTEEIGREIRLLLRNKNLFYTRFVDAYPEVIYRTDKVKARLEEIRLETEHLRQDAERRMDALSKKLEQEKEQLAANLEPVSYVQRSIIEQQDQLIALLYDEATATDEMKQLAEQIAMKKKTAERRKHPVSDLRK